ncbi:MAG: chemotaxis-specific protein-glutamate methyltransferase CheB [Candidatus Omnitrophota bacterium]
MGSEKIRVLIVDDSALMREALRVILEEDPSVEVIGIAKDGREGVEKALALKPNVITMDLKMPVMTGLEAIEKIMEEMPIPIVVVSSMDTSVVVKALSIGAMDFVAVSNDIDTIAKELIDKVKIASRVKAIRRFKVKPYRATSERITRGKVSKIIVVGVSTGGPQALQEMLSKIPEDFCAGILIVQHMSKGFIEGLAEWLNASSSLDVRVAKAGDELKQGLALLAPDDYNMCIGRDGVIVLKENMLKTATHIPSIDATMKSAAESYRENAVGVIMTGMGRDGVDGIRAIKGAGGTTIAQDQNSSVIFGMNKMAIETGCVDRIVSISEMAKVIAGVV